MAPTLESKLALIVDEDPRTSEVLFQLLEGQGFWPVTAADADEAYEILHQGPPALVAVDLEEPRGAGREILEALASNPAWTHIPVVALSGRAADDAQDGGAAAAARLPKPLDVALFVREVKRLSKACALLRPERLH